MERPDGHAAISIEPFWPARPSLVERDHHGDADRPQGRDCRREGTGDDDGRLLTQPELVRQAWDYFRTVQTKDIKYQPLISPKDEPAIWFNKKIMDEYRPRMRAFYYNPAMYGTYLEQLVFATATWRISTARGTQNNPACLLSRSLRCARD